MFSPGLYMFSTLGLPWPELCCERGELQGPVSLLPVSVKSVPVTCCPPHFLRKREPTSSAQKENYTSLQHKFRTYKSRARDLT